MRHNRSRHIAAGQLSPKVREQAATARVVAQIHPGSNGAHVLELTTEGMLGYLRIHRGHFDDIRRAIDAAEARCETLDDLPEAPFARPPERVDF